MEIDNLEIPLVLTYDNKPNDYTHNFLYTLKKHKWDYILIGEGEVWKGFTSKMEGYKRTLETLPSKKVVILSDARDVFCLRTPTNFMYYKKIIKQHIIVSMEIFGGGRVFPPDDLYNEQCVVLKKFFEAYNVNPKPFLRKFVNSGLICGNAQSLLEFLNFALENKYTDDQLALGTFMNTYPEKVYADIHANLLHTSTFGVYAGMYKVSYQKQDSPTLAELFGRSAYFLHIPGCINKGQKLIYNTTWEIIKTGVCDEKLREGYGSPEPGPNDYNYEDDKI